MVYSVGQRVVLLPHRYASKMRRNMNGHTCIIKEVFPFYESVCYLLEWRQVDNPGQHCLLNMDIATFHEEDFTAVLLPGTIVHSYGLPDV